MSAILDDDEDVLAGNTGERTVVVNPRELALQAIEDGRIREFEQETGVKVPAQPVLDEDMDADDVAAEQERARLQAVADGKAVAASRPAPADDDQLQRQVQSQIQSGAPTVIDNFDNVVVKRKVNGVEELVPLADVMRTHQKTAAADQRLEEATRLLRDAEARSRAVPEAPAPAATPPKDEAADIAAELTTALFAGDEEKARELLRQGLSRPSTPTPAPVPSVDVLAEQVEQQIAVKGALREFQRDYSRLVDDPELATLSDMRINHLVTGGMPMAEAIRTAGRALYEKFGWSAPAPERPAPAPVSTTRADKLKAKQDLDPVQGRSIAATALSDENTPETTSDVIAQMRKARGQI
jgi:hypothetical protein